ncbi:MAG: hypothetical protein FWF25_05740 [Propionibacteriaceae bacterium]|nr:hypothetical protein [Propionibacteriaceae bacterium]
MAHVVLGVGTSHTPHLSTPTSMWWERAEQDHTNPLLFDRDGVLRDYAGVLAGAGDRYQDRASRSEALWEAADQKAQAALDKLRDEIKAAAPDVVIIVGDDQAEMFSADNQPSMAVGGAATMVTGVHNRDAMFHDSAFLIEATKGYWQDTPHTFTGAPELATDLVHQLTGNGVDVGWLGGNTGYGHAFGFILNRLLSPTPPPVIPFLVNCFFGPNQPTPKRCVEVGRALRKAIDASPIDARVALVASGGLSHFVVNEELDLGTLQALQSKDWDYLASTPAELLQGGTSENRNWILVGAAMGDATMDWWEYTDLIRTEAGTGCGLAFATWR